MDRDVLEGGEFGAVGRVVSVGDDDVMDDAICGVVPSVAGGRLKLSLHAWINTPPPRRNIHHGELHD